VTTLKVGIASYEQMKARTLEVARGERRVRKDGPKIWFTSMESFAKVLSDRNRALLSLIAEMQRSRSRPGCDLRSANRPGGLNMVAISRVYTISHAAKILNEDEDWLQELSITMDPEDGRLYIVGTREETITGFTEHGIECLREIVAIERAK
jgi:hypothetical protein